MKKITDAQKRAKQKYLSKKHRIEVLVRKGAEEIIKQYADKRGISMSEYIRDAIQTAIYNDNAQTIPDNTEATATQPRQAPRMRKAIKKR